MPRGIVVKNKNGGLIVNCISNSVYDYRKTQQGLAIAPIYFDKFNLKEHDEVGYSHTGDLFDFIKIDYKVIDE